VGSKGPQEVPDSGPRELAAWVTVFSREKVCNRKPAAVCPCSDKPLLPVGSVHGLLSGLRAEPFRRIAHCVVNYFGPLRKIGARDQSPDRAATDDAIEWRVSEPRARPRPLLAEEAHALGWLGRERQASSSHGSLVIPAKASTAGLAWRCGIDHCRQSTTSNQGLAMLR